MKIAPSILNLTEDKFSSKMDEFIQAGIEYLHLDIMDGIFVTNNTKKVELLKSVNKYPFIFDSHLMVINPLDYVDDFVQAGTNIITFHVEAKTDVNRTIDYIHSKNIKAGISIKPNTEVSQIIPYLNKVDLVLVMSVEPGYGGQTFMTSSLTKVKELNDYRQEHHLNYLIEVDGGINLDNSKELKKVGCDIVVMGTFLLKNDSRDIVSKVNKL